MNAHWGSYLRLYMDNGKENGSCRGFYGVDIRVILGLYRDNGIENGNCYLGFRVKG